MGQVWYCLIKGQELGPFDTARLRALAEQQELLPDHHVRLSPSNHWTVAAKVKGLFAQKARVGPHARRWSVRVKDREFGPYTDDQLKRLATREELRPEHLIRIVGKSEWHEARKIQGLFDAPAAKASASAGPKSPAVDERVRFACQACGRLL